MEKEKKKGLGEGLGHGEQGLNKGEVWVVGGANAQDPQGWKRPCGGWGLGSRNRRGPGVPPTPDVRAGDLTWEPSSLPGLEWAGQTPSSPLTCSSGLMSGRAPPACLS